MKPKAKKKVIRGVPDAEKKENEPTLDELKKENEQLRNTVDQMQRALMKAKDMAFFMQEQFFDRMTGRGHGQ